VFVPIDHARDPIIVFGAPRSGTTYLESILNGHPYVFISHETRLFAWLHQALDVLGQDDRWLLTHRDAFISDLRRVFPDVIRDFYRELAPEARYWGDKNPHYADPRSAGCLEMINELFPESLFIHIVRDGREVVSSLLRKTTDEGIPWVEFRPAHYTWMSHVDSGSTFGKTLPQDRYFELRYEHLVADDVGIAREVFRFIGLDLHPDVESFCRAQQEKRTPLKEPMRNLDEGVTTSDWPKILTPQQQGESLELIGSRLVRYGYETEASLAELRERCVAASGGAR
jgi:hypothetical protein